MRRFVIYISLLLIISSFSQKARVPATIVLDKKQKTIELIHHRHLYFIRVKLNNRNANLLIDTGAAASLLDINKANDYKFDYYQTESTFAGVGGLSKRYRVTKYKIAHDSTELKLYPFGADLKMVGESFEESGMSIAGIIGSDFLKANDAIIDYKNKQLIIQN